MRRLVLGVVLGAAALIWLGAPAPASAQTSRLGGDDLVLRGDAVCTSCHNEDWPTPILTIGKTRHGTTADARAPTCTSCHGAFGAHINAPTPANKPNRYFAKTSTTPVPVRNQACLACHQGGARMLWSESTHEQ